MTRDRLLHELRLVAEAYDPEAAHALADKLLMQFINDPEIIEAYNKITKWYA